MVDTELAPRQQAFHVATAMKKNKQWWIFRRHCVQLRPVIQSHRTRVQWVPSEAENSTKVAIMRLLGFISRWGIQQVSILKLNMHHKHTHTQMGSSVNNPTQTSWMKNFPSLNQHREVNAIWPQWYFGSTKVNDHITYQGLASDAITKSHTLLACDSWIHSPLRAGWDEPGCQKWETDLLAMCKTLSWPNRGMT